ncbi:formylglycine-generating enzyme family protein [Chamaesiphon sp. OTE_20_metabat_361]|uniref:formylglycine-generating enzyme family protein n=2 Tax=unclassified Chamaesiphon TaxID=2620921 RepID=UPI00286AFBE3|nr:formylglycine-generating enzyme family protein [Chamaesiphon sp. OTE_20_metabat_361]
MSSVAVTTFSFETVSLDRNGEIIDRQPRSAQCLIESLGGSLTLELVLIPSGTFMMGDARHHQDEQPIHPVAIPSFYMGKYPITQAQYRSVMDGSNLETALDYPIENISWHDAREFCTKLSQKTVREYTLPSEAQWEYACRAGTDTAFYFGDIITPELVNYNGNYPYNGAPVGENRGEATPVGIFPPNAFGLYDMHGSVWEWCLDGYQASYQGAPTDGTAWVADRSDANIKRVMRGGSWDYVARGCRSAVRCSLAPEIRIGGCGLRVVLDTDFNKAVKPGNG